MVTAVLTFFWCWGGEGGGGRVFSLKAVAVMRANHGHAGIDAAGGKKTGVYIVAKMVVEGKAVRVVVVVIGIMKLRWLTIVRYDMVLAKKFPKSLPFL